MERIIKAGRLFYGIAMAAVGVQQFFYGSFCLMLFPSWPIDIPGVAIIAYIGSAALVGVGVAIVLEKRAREVSLVLGGVLLALFCFSYAPYEIIVDPYSKHLGSWTNALKELALSGGAFVVAGSFPEQESNHKESFLINFLEKMIPFGSIFFSITMISFGIAHFLYVQFVSTLVPAWIPDHIFWTYFAAVALIGSGVAIILKIRLKAIGILLGTMIFLWFVFLHIPRAVADPFIQRGNEITSAFSALAFSGIAFVISGGYYTKKGRIT
jgi:hypothetical protein